MALDSLTDHDIAILTLEAQWWATAGGKDRAIRDQLGMTPVRYYQRLNQLLDSKPALAHDPVTVRRALRLRARPNRVRASRRTWA